MYWSRHKHWQFMNHLKSLFAILISLQYLIQYVNLLIEPIWKILRHTTIWDGIPSVRLIRKTLFIQLMLSNELADVVLGVRTKPKTMNKLLNPLSKHLVLRNYCRWCQKSTFQKRWQLVNLLGQIPFIVGWTTKQLWYMESCRLKISRNIWFGGTAEKTYICK